MASRPESLSDRPSAGRKECGRGHHPRSVFPPPRLRPAPAPPKTGRRGGTSLASAGGRRRAMAPSRIQIERVLCPVDFSDFSARALARACDVAAWFDARVTVVHVCPNLIPGGLETPRFPVPAETMRAGREQSREELARFTEPFLTREVPLVTEVWEGEAWRAILEEAASLPADLVVMGTHGRTGFEHLLLGSVTEKVLRRAGCPVLVVGAEGSASVPGLFRRILCAVDLYEQVPVPPMTPPITPPGTPPTTPPWTPPSMPWGTPASLPVGLPTRSSVSAVRSGEGATTSTGASSRSAERAGGIVGTITCTLTGNARAVDAAAP